MNATKICSKCDVEKSHDEFYAKPGGRDGLFAHCKDCHRLVVRSYREANAEQVQKFVSEYSKEYYLKNKEKLKSLRDGARDEMRRRIAEGENFDMDGAVIRCRRCETERPVDDYHRSSSHRNGRQSICRYCNSERNRDAYRRGRQEIFDFLGGACVCCGETESAFLQVDHVNGGGGKERKIKNSLAALRVRVRTAPADFQLLCANCHAAKLTLDMCPHKARRADRPSRGS